MVQNNVIFNYSPKRKLFWIALGTILITFGGLMTIPFTIKGGNFYYGLLFTYLLVIIGILLIAWVLGDNNG